ncbi:MAG: hypothetical protein E4H37_08685 [Gemmatimonadales bacterium]|nr:MAG: hypothetical protein E4H37_08685 [Gemmatimonadales bacterium]
MSYYGAGKYLRVDKQPEYVVLPRDGISFDNRALLNEHGYEETFRAKTLVVYRGAGTPARAWDSEAAARVGATGGALAGGNGLSSTGDVQLASELLARSITAGVTGRVIYVDGCYGVTPSGLDILNRNGNKVNLYRQGFQFNRDRLFQSGLLIMQYAVGRPEPTEAEYEIIRRYVANGGRLLLMCPAWVWPAYDKKPLHQLPYRRIAEQFELEMEAGYVNAPLTIEHADFGVEGADELLRGAFSAIDYQPQSGAFPIVVGNSGNAGSVAAQKGNARIIVWGQNNLLSSEAAGRPGAVEFVGKAVNWLLAPPVGGGVDGTAEDRPFGEDNEGQTHDAPLKARSM